MGSDPTEYCVQDAITQFRSFIELDRKHRAEGLTSAEAERWSTLKRRFAKQFSPHLSDERADERASVRVPTRLRVDFSSVAELRDQRMTNLSRGGLFVATTHLLDIGTKVTLLLAVGTGGERLEVPAEVASHNVGPRFSVDPPGMGLRFLDMPAATKRALETLYETSLEQATARPASD
jgi:uncharacterized protein (TIGR02266 family)